MSIRKIMRISLVDGRTIQNNVEDVPFYDRNGNIIRPANMIGVNMNDPIYALAAYGVATGGCSDPQSTKDHYIHIAPSQIRHVEFMRTEVNDGVISAGEKNALEDQQADNERTLNIAD